MSWILLENGNLLNADQVTHVQFIDSGTHEGKALAFGYGAGMSPESKAVFDHFDPIRKGLLKDGEAERQAEIRTANLRAAKD